ncbi:MAG TPA: phosphate-starvation-inducible PsiE family protein [Bacteroidales bacterium]|nr:phosphate-starvation-inducible PsiE family protein [Bacteroidales bacterium]
MNKLARKVEKIIIYSLIVMMAGILILATVELGYYLIRTILSSDYLLIDLNDLMDLFGVFMLVLIGIELLDTIKVYLHSNIVHVEVVVLVAIIALARKVIALKTENMSGDKIIGIAVLIVALGLTYYLIKRAGLMACKMDDDKADPREALGKGDEDEI